MEQKNITYELVSASASGQNNSKVALKWLQEAFKNKLKVHKIFNEGVGGQ